jgi:hypothetical protein
MSRRVTCSSTRFAREMRSISVLPQVGQDMKRTPPRRSPAAFRMATPVFTSSAGSAVRDTRMVSPRPSFKSVPMPTADSMVPFHWVPVSVTPRCSG